MPCHLLNPLANPISLTRFPGANPVNSDLDVCGNSLGNSLSRSLELGAAPGAGHRTREFGAGDSEEQPIAVQTENSRVFD